MSLGFSNDFGTNYGEPLPKEDTLEWYKNRVSYLESKLRMSERARSIAYTMYYSLSKLSLGEDPWKELCATLFKEHIGCSSPIHVASFPISGNNWLRRKYLYFAFCEDHLIRGRVAESAKEAVALWKKAQA